jgi:hypothetical protein
MLRCENCGGEGRLLQGRAGANDPDEIDMGECQICKGEGLVCPFCAIGMPLMDYPFEREPVHTVRGVPMPCMTIPSLKG